MNESRWEPLYIFLFPVFYLVNESIIHKLASHFLVSDDRENIEKTRLRETKVKFCIATDAKVAFFSIGM
jgi:hypothetical protein